MKLSFLSLASGSSGNCYYLGTPEFGVLIDAGIGIRTIKKVLKDKAIDFSKIVAVLITHDHADHIKTVGCLGEKHCIPVYTTEAVHRGISKSRYVEETLVSSRKVIEKEVPFMIRDFRITAFARMIVPIMWVIISNMEIISLRWQRMSAILPKR